MFCISVVRLRIDAGVIQAGASRVSKPEEWGEIYTATPWLWGKSWSCVAAMALDPVGSSVTAACLDSNSNQANLTDCFQGGFALTPEITAPCF